MRHATFAALVLILAAGTAAASITLLVSGKYNRAELEARWCARLYGDAGCDNCLNEQWADWDSPWSGEDDLSCNTLAPFCLTRVYQFEQGDWTKFGLWLTSAAQLRNAVDQCGLDYNNPDHTRFGYNCASEYVEIRGGFIVGSEFDVGATLPPRIDPHLGPPTGDEVYPFVMDFAALEANVAEMAFDERLSHLTPWGIVFAASYREWVETGREQALWNMAHSLPCWQSCLDGWECGRGVIDALPPGFPEWPFDYTQQPTYLFHLYLAVAPYLDVTVRTEPRTWSDLKALYR
ncbi:MAG: hypothetical protein R3D98_15745 [Candidatus Krumholzibacteriia bacterium]